MKIFSKVLIGTLLVGSSLCAEEEQKSSVREVEDFGGHSREWCHGCDWDQAMEHARQQDNYYNSDKDSQTNKD